MSIKYKNVIKKEADSFICDKCKVENTNQGISDGVKVEHTFGYYSPNKLDGSNVEIILCEKCFVEILKREDLFTLQDKKNNDWGDLFKTLADLSACIYPEYSDEMIDNNVNNGKEGVWSIEGIRHSAMVKANSARAALNQLDGYVGSWELCDIKYIGKEHPRIVKII